MPKKEVQLDKDIAIRKADTFGNHEIYRPSGGRLPAELRGLFTSPNTAKRTLDAYLATQGIIDQENKIKEEIKSINPLDHLYDEV